jgi:hypothetical protein
MACAWSPQGAELEKGILDGPDVAPMSFLYAQSSNTAQDRGEISTSTHPCPHGNAIRARVWSETASTLMRNDRRSEVGHLQPGLFVQVGCDSNGLARGLRPAH